MNTSTAIAGLSDPDLLRMQCLIDGQWTGDTGADACDVQNPATG